MFDTIKFGVYDDFWDIGVNIGIVGGRVLSVFFVSIESGVCKVLGKSNLVQELYGCLFRLFPDERVSVVDIILWIALQCHDGIVG